MAITRLNITDFIELASNYPVLDVRSPGEFLHAHIPGAFSLPLFSDEERRVVGTAYKQQGKQQAIRIGLSSFGSKLLPMIDEVISICEKYYAGGENNQSVLVHCWRGGMRSAGVAWLLDLYGFKVYTLVGGYKAYRNWVLDQFSKDYKLQILGGYTGSGKTELLDQLELAGDQVIHFEKMASHKGSAFGAIGMAAQPTQEMFENCLAEKLHRSNKKDDLVIWVEDESRRIGNITIPLPLYNTMRNKPVVFLSIPFEARLQNIVVTYGCLNKEELVAAIERIQKRLGGLETRKAINFLLENDIASSFGILLAYYDKCYEKALHNRDNLKALITTIETPQVDSQANVALLTHTLNIKND
ncbi:MAG: tRNA 2-selenouridine(34) synthase MnmH [Bacteroidota bacterium]